MCLSNYLRSCGALAAACCEPLRSIHHRVYLASELPAAPSSKQSAAYFRLLLPRRSAVRTLHKRTTLMRGRKAIKSLSAKLFCSGADPYIQPRMSMFFFLRRCQTFLFRPVNSAVVLCGLWPDFLNRNHLSEAKWWLRDVIAAVRG